MDIYREFIENSIDPFILFDSQGAVIEYNKEGEYILSVANKEELFNLAISHASMTFGFRHSFIQIDIGHSSFCAITVGYKDSDRIGLMLHKNVCSKRLLPSQENLQYANIFTLIDIALNINLDESCTIITDYDVSIPEFKLDIDKFLRLLNKIFKALQGQKQLLLRVAIATGRNIKIEDKKYQVVLFEITGDNLPTIDLFNESFIIVSDKDRIAIELPFIL